MSKYKSLLKNIGLLTLSSFATKLLSFFLVPLYTSVLSTSEFGTYDMFNTTVSLLFPIITVDIQEAVLRFSLDSRSNEGKILKTAAKYLLLSVIIILVLLVFNYIFNFINIFNKYVIEFFLLYLVTAINGLITYYARGIDNVKELSISSVLGAIVSISLNIYFLVIIKIGLLGYFYATIIAGAAQSLYLIIKLQILDKLINTDTDKKLSEQMVNYSKPMVANAVSWWINNASDRYIVIWLSGIAANGIYSVSYKIPSIINILQQIFGQAWTISAVKEFDQDDSSGFYINVYNLYNFMLVSSCSFLILADKIISKFLFAKDFYLAWKYAPFLLISTVFAGMSAFIGGLFSAMKDSKTFAQTSVITAIINTIGNLALVALIGPLGAAISTAIAYFLMWALRLKAVKNSFNLRVNLKRDLTIYILLIVQSVFLIFDIFSPIFTNIINILIFLFIIIVYKTVWKGLLLKLLNR